MFLVTGLTHCTIRSDWLLVYGDLDGEESIMLERVPVDTLNDYGGTPSGVTPSTREEEDSAPPAADDDLPY